MAVFESTEKHGYLALVKAKLWVKIIPAFQLPKLRRGGEVDGKCTLHLTLLESHSSLVLMCPNIGKCFLFPAQFDLGF